MIFSSEANRIMNETKRRGGAELTRENWLEKWISAIFQAWYLKGKELTKEKYTHKACN